MVKERVIKRKIKKFGRSSFESVEKILDRVFDSGFVS